MIHYMIIVVEKLAGKKHININWVGQGKIGIQALGLTCMIKDTG